MNAKTNWLTLFGPISYENGVITYSPPTPPEQDAVDGVAVRPFGMVRSSVVFSEGTIEARVSFDGPETAVVLLLNTSDKTELMFHVRASGRSPLYFISEGTPGTDSTTLGFAGGLATRDPKVPVQMKVDITGSRVRLYIDDVLAAEANKTIVKSALQFRVDGHYGARIDQLVVRPRQMTAFVVMQFTDEYNDLYTEVIEPTCLAFGFKANRVDNMYSNGLILEDILQQLNESSVVIADITPDNPNVFYEVGYSHGVGKPTILLSDKKRERLPFDISGFRTLFYDNTIAGKSQIEERLAHHLKALTT